MQCLRCNKPFSTDQAERNAEVYGANLLACPHCGQAYGVSREIKIHIDPIHTSRTEDDWGNKITQPPKK